MVKGSIRRYRGLVVTLAFSMALVGCGTASAPPVPAASSSALPSARAQALQTKAIALTEEMERGEYANTVALADETLKAAGVDAAMLRAGWEQLAPTVGAYESITGAFSTSLPAGDVVSVVAKHATKSVRVLYSFQPGGDKLNGLHLNVATDAEIAQAKGDAPSDSATPSATGSHSVDTAITVGTHQLPGTLTTPAGEAKRPIVVVLLWGSGPQDRDETVGAAGNKMFRDLADALASEGISSLRFDKRTKAAPASFTPSSTLTDEYFDDAKAAIALVKSQLPGYRVFVVGHSLGAMVLPNVLAVNPEAAGGVSLAGSPRSLFDIMYDQNVTAVAALAGKTDAEKKAMLADARRIMDAAKAVKDANGAVPPELASSMPAAYVASINALRQGEVAQSLTVPLLLVHGEADQQVSASADFGAWKTLLAGRANVTFKSYPGLNHLFMKTNGLPAPADYDAPATLDRQVAGDIASWLVAHAG